MRSCCCSSEALATTRCIHSSSVQPSWLRCHSCSHGLRLCFSLKVLTMLASSEDSAPSRSTFASIAAYSSLRLRESIRWKRMSARKSTKALRNSASLFRSCSRSASVQTSTRQTVRDTSSATQCPEAGCQPLLVKRARKLISPSQPPAWPPSSTRLTCKSSPQSTATSPSMSSISSERGPVPSCRRWAPAGTETLRAKFMRLKNCRVVMPDLENCLSKSSNSSVATNRPAMRSITKRMIMFRFAMPNNVPQKIGPQRMGRRENQKDMEQRLPVKVSSRRKRMSFMKTPVRLSMVPQW
mmetsp:Transcript_19572/g.62134  ORF Transcript_19572/g.62134 Transcript_19572/m.62134 type:complete len:297 (-) Transcript_19572:411-1301(-)